MGELAQILEEAAKKGEEPELPKHMKWWQTLLIGAAPAIIAGYFSVRQSIVEAGAANDKASASYSATLEVVKVLQEHDDQRVKETAMLNGQILVIEQLLQMLVGNKAAHAMLHFKPLPNIRQTRLVLPSNIEDAVSVVKSGRMSQLVKQEAQVAVSDSPAATE